MVGKDEQISSNKIKEIEVNQEVEQQIECVACPWNKQCIEPPMMTEEEVKAKMDEGKPEASMSQEEAEGKLMGGIVSALFFVGKDTEARICKVFANALRKSPDISNQIKAIMQAK